MQVIYLYIYLHLAPHYKDCISITQRISKNYSTFEPKILADKRWTTADIVKSLNLCLNRYPLVKLICKPLVLNILKS